MVETNFNERTGQTEYWDNATARWIPFNGEDGIPTGTSIPSLISIEDIKNRTPFSVDPYYGTLVADPNANVPTDPNEYYRQLGSELAKQSFNLSGFNQDSSQYDTLIEGLKDISPQGYYTAKIDMLSRAAGNNYINNEMGRMDTINKQIEALLPEAQKAGVTPEQINSIYSSGSSYGAQAGGQYLANLQSQKGGFLAPLIEGIKFVGPGLLGMYGIDAALTAGLGAAYGAASGMSTVGLGSGLGGAAALEGGALASGLGAAGAGGGGLAGLGAIDSTAAALGGSGGGGLFTPTAGSSFAIAPEAAYGLANATAPLTTTEILSSTGFTPTAGNSFTIDPSAVYTTAGNITSNPVTQEMIDFANARPDPIQAMSEMQNMTPSELSTALGSGAGTGLLSDVGSLLKGAQVAKGLLGVGKNPLQPGSQPQTQMQGGRQYAGVDYAPILNLLNIQQPQRNRNSLLG
jgi:hypothetical protein